jgi:CubicO group peptidase (beta-lactamase class C family)
MSSTGRTSNISDLMEKAHIPGISIATISDGKVSGSTVLGFSDMESRTPVTPDTIFWACSLSKPVFAYLVISLMQSGKLGKDFTLDTPLWEIFDWDYFNHDERRKTITARMILSHQTGMPNEGKLDDTFNPGQLFRYSGEGYIYLQKVIEKITGLPLEELAKKEIFIPLEMKHSSFLLPEPEVLAATHDEIMNPLIPLPLLTPGNNNHPAASLHTTASDYALFLEACLKNKEFFEIALKTPHVSMEKDKEAIDKKVEQETLQSIHWGLGFGLQKSPGKDNSDIAFHWGHGPGARGFFAINLHSHSAVVYLANSENGLTIAEDVVTPIVGNIKPTIDYLFEKYDYQHYSELETQYHVPVPNNRLKWLNELKYCKENPIPIEKDTLQKYAGEYGPFKITLQNNSLKMSFFGTPHDLIPLSETLFASRNDVTLRLEFNKEKNELRCQFLNPKFELREKEFSKSNPAQKQLEEKRVTMFGLFKSSDQLDKLIEEKKQREAKSKSVHDLTPSEKEKIIFSRPPSPPKKH